MTLAFNLRYVELRSWFLAQTNCFSFPDFCHLFIEFKIPILLQDKQVGFSLG